MKKKQVHEPKHWRHVMKCAVCGYCFNEKDLQRQRDSRVDGDQPFIKLINTFHRKDDDGHLDEAYLYACPKCSTVRMELW